jgi:DNA-binding Xre family transcriptional regulator
MEADIMTISCKLRILLVQANVERAKQGKTALSLRRLAEESGVSLSVLASLHTGKSQRIDYTTIDHLLTYFNQYFHFTTAELLAWDHNVPAS